MKKTIKIVVDNQTLNEGFKLVTREDGVTLFPDFKVELHNVDHKGFIAKRNANKIVNDYAVTKLPFVLLCDGDKEYAAVYSETGDITQERINEKL